MTSIKADPAWQSSERYARAALSFVAEPADLAIGAALRAAGARRVLDCVLSDCDAGVLAVCWPAVHDGGSACAEADGHASTCAEADNRDRVEVRLTVTGARRAVERMRSRRAALPSPARVEAWQRDGYRLVCPGEPEWPTQLDDLGDARPIMLWVRGIADLRFACLRSVSVVGSRAATSYGCVVGTELAADLAARAFTVISGGAYGIDECAHRGALSAGGSTVAVLASGLTFGYPKGHVELFAEISQTGVMVSERPPDHAPTRPGFLVRNRMIAALSRGTVVVEAALRSGALNTARHAAELNRPIMAVPGPVTSAQSAGCHELIRGCAAVCVTGAADVAEVVGPVGEDLGLPESGPAVPVEQLDPVTASVLAAMSGRTGRGPATIATLAGVDLDTAMRCLGLLSAAGYAERRDNGWRATRR
ncbi:MAG TPA: DNA-processing protein DprA [Streptosporangiaceae bacterium]|nr:DNA-processing protein DprA [Streptosporangiaceae bacterium]